MKILIVKEKEIHSRTGVAFRARNADTLTSLFMGEETLDALVRRIRAHWPNAEIVNLDEISR